MIITIDSSITSKCPDFTIIGYLCDVDNQTTDQVTQLLNDTQNQLKDLCLLEDVVKVPKIKYARDGYKALGKDPSRYRLAAEGLLRRVIRQLGIYRIGDIVDLGNILSLLTLRSVCVVDADLLVGDITIRVGNPTDQFIAINRGNLNVSNIPVYVDQISPFGSPTSDTIRTQVTAQTKKILIMIICFEPSNLIEDQNLLIDLYTKYANATNFIKVEVRK